jgi:hypothetical protein
MVSVLGVVLVLGGVGCGVVGGVGGVVWWGLCGFQFKGLNYRNLVLFGVDSTTQKKLNHAVAIQVTDASPVMPGSALNFKLGSYCSHVLSAVWCQ